MISAQQQTRQMTADLDPSLLLNAYRLMFTAKTMADLYEERKDVCGRYVHSTSRGHEAIQVALGMQVRQTDYLSVYYRDHAVHLALGLEPRELMLQLMAKRDDPFSGGRSYYCHPSLRREGFPVIPHQSAATGMQAIPATGMAHAIQYLEAIGKLDTSAHAVAVCSLGDGSVTEGEVAEALQMAVLKRLPILYLVQDNGWGISATGAEMRAMNAYEYAAGFAGLERYTTDGSDFSASYRCVAEALAHVRGHRGPALVHATCPLLGHHTSGVRREWYRGEDLELHRQRDPVLRLRAVIAATGAASEKIAGVEKEVTAAVASAYSDAVASPDPDPAAVTTHEFAPSPVTTEQGRRTGPGTEKVLMVDAALHALDEILRSYPEALFYGQDVGRRLGGVFREAASLAQKYGDHRVFNTPIQEAYIIGSTAGMAAVGAKPIVEIQFADYVWPGINQLVTEISKSCYLSMGKFPVQTLIRIPVGAYGGGGPYHSGSIESALLTIRGIKVVYPSNAADIKGLMKAAFLDPNPVIMLEHKGLYWSRVPGTAEAKTVEPDEAYVVPLGSARTVLAASPGEASSCMVVTYGMGVYWAMEAANRFPGRVEVLDLRTLNPLDWAAVADGVRRHSRVLVLTEEPLLNSFAESLAGRIATTCFEFLDAPPAMVGAMNVPAVPLNVSLEREMLPDAARVAAAIDGLLRY